MNRLDLRRSMRQVEPGIGEPVTGTNAHAKNIAGKMAAREKPSQSTAKFDD